MDNYPTTVDNRPETVEESADFVDNAQGAPYVTGRDRTVRDFRDLHGSVGSTGRGPNRHRARRVPPDPLTERLLFHAYGIDE